MQLRASSSPLSLHCSLLRYLPGIKASSPVTAERLLNARPSKPIEVRAPTSFKHDAPALSVELLSWVVGVWKGLHCPLGTTPSDRAARKN